MIHILDNGAGIEETKLIELKKLLEDEREMQYISMKVKRIGIANTCLRIKNFFGDAYGIEIDSTVESGTEVTVHIPVEKVRKESSF